MTKMAGGFVLLCWGASALLVAGCPAGDCEPHAGIFCTDEADTYWVDSCGHLEERIEHCACGCAPARDGCLDCPCTEGDLTCNGSWVQRCQDQSWTPVQDCAALGLPCQNGQCGAGQCTDGDKRCVGTVAELCVGGSWRTSDCATTGKICRGGDCLDPCSAGQSRCSGDWIESCQDGVFAAQTDCAALGKTCQEAQCRDGCSTGARRCRQAVVQECRSGNWIDVTDCGSAGLSCIDGSCRGGVTGVLHAGTADIQFNEAAVGLSHKRDVDAAEDGCLVHIDLALSRGGSCQLELSAGERYRWQGGLVLLEARFTADSFCPDFPDSAEGIYTGTLGLTLGEIEPGLRKVPDRNAATSRFVTTLTVRLQGVLTRADGAQLAIASSTLTVWDEFVSYGSTSVSCPCEPDCNARACGDDACGGSCGECPTNEICTPLFTCAESFCGDGRITGTEQCDGADLGGEGCADRGYDAGALACDPATCLVDTRGCYQRLVPQGTETQTDFGAALALDGDLLAVGAPRAGATDPGAAWIFTRDAERRWSLTTRLDPNYSSNYDRFGATLALNERHLLVGMPGHDATLSGTLYTDWGSSFYFDGSSGSWALRNAYYDISLQNSFLRQGASVALRGTDLLVGAPSAGMRAGLVLRIDRAASQPLQQPLKPAIGSSSDEFGASLAFWGSDEAVVGAPGWGSKGAVFVFRNWVEATRFVPEAEATRFGMTLATSGDTLVVGSNGAAFVYLKEDFGNYSLQARLVGDDTQAADGFGKSVAIHGDAILVGAPQASPAGITNQGAAYLFIRNSGVWTQARRLVSESPLANDNFGAAVALDDAHLVIGISQTAASGAASGVVRVYER
ncbi:MAG: hypothetical protein GYA21_07085 [Myxococcales bacterium]|nr:hypothetical protein [Myxococcales bacterium]